MSSETPIEPPPFRRTPPEAVAIVAQEKVIIGDRTFVLVRPDQSDQLLTHPVIQSAFAVDEYLPYWADLWPGARMLAKAILQENWQTGLHALELGCGLGLPGIAALARGLRVTFSDYDLTALDFAARNARANGFDQFELLPLDWRRPPADLRVSVLLGSDLVYEIRNVAPLVKVIKSLLAPAGVCLITDQDRAPAYLLRETLLDAGLTFSTKVMHAGEPGGKRMRGTLYRIGFGPRS